MNAKLLLGLVVILGGLGLGWYVLKGNTSMSTTTPTPTPITTEVMTEGTPTTSETPATTSEAMMEEGTVTAKTTVTYSSTGFTPGTITVKKGTTVRFVNESSGGMWVASALHPTHQLLPGFDQLLSAVKGGSYDYTFTKVGTWKYHNHMKASDTGTVVVTE